MIIASRPFADHLSRGNALKCQPLLPRGSANRIHYDIRKLVFVLSFIQDTPNSIFDIPGDGRLASPRTRSTMLEASAVRATTQPPRFITSQFSERSTAPPPDATTMPFRSKTRAVQQILPHENTALHPLQTSRKSFCLPPSQFPHPDRSGCSRACLPGDALRLTCPYPSSRSE